MNLRAWISPYSHLGIGRAAGARSLFRQVAHSGIEEDADPDEVYQYFRWSESRAHEATRVLLVDEADRGHVDAIARCCRHSGLIAPLPVPVLAGHERLESLLMPAVGASNLHHIVLRPLTQAETADYLRPRVERAGGKTAELMSPAKLGSRLSVTEPSPVFVGWRRVFGWIWWPERQGAVV